MYHTIEKFDSYVKEDYDGTYSVRYSSKQNSVQMVTNMEIGRAILLYSGSYSQNNARFGENRNNQCVPIAMAMSAQVQINPNHIPSTQVIDEIIDAGDCHYSKTRRKLNHNFKHLSMNEAAVDPIQIGSDFYKISFTTTRGAFPTNESEYDDKVRELYSNFVELMIQNPGKSLVFIGVAMALSIWEKTPNYYLFDSHAMDEYGNLKKDGLARLFEFNSLRDLAHFLMRRVTKYTYEKLMCYTYELHAINAEPAVVYCGSENQPINFKQFGTMADGLEIYKPTYSNYWSGVARNKLMIRLIPLREGSKVTEVVGYIFGEGLGDMKYSQEKVKIH
ncbi:uncharacterized protein LOC111057671 [Nilaparvata lugens]|uniref:uncharacterized protein LOC111057671 n=1 Tax=Nilaparvata lugens TaxID=108931 RepID=UPI00193DF982|nr:uncharacterized protein LOC111057671 [Nilaparvata lugens]XP_039292880.1 uncharacterized protein LOC111057671 [Nilaparvata lugens]XP_039292888.1 uncharacterized protein LOC111057671 [Nilaparvata lugens]XP_039292890.1 uncharacterized protein LOC111057671 [Nilaparvata lugens]XP_039292898.1 uncharacterized protein LOC111057671 [Nilaparvata lugens]